ncbi:MAG TPA: hypothetical protein VHB46_05835 [Burkholderiales bacterium]|nr:hypothetical protein [Burkholderiales bacterium]
MDASGLSPRQRSMLCIVVCAMASIPILLYFGVIPWTPPKRCRAVFCDPYHWQLPAIGIAFFCAGLSLVIPPERRVLARINGLAILGGFMAGVAGSFFFR